MFSFQGISKYPDKIATQRSGCDFERRNNGISEPWTLGRGEGYEVCSDELVLIGVRVHLFPSRTQKLSSLAPTILAG